MDKIWWHTTNEHSPSMSKASLGKFVYTVLQAGGEIGEVWKFKSNSGIDSVFFTVKMTYEQKIMIEKIGVKFDQTYTKSDKKEKELVQW
jgi:hypothetical protein